MGSKSLAEYNEVRGYADATRWVYRQALEPGESFDGRLVTIGEIRQAHHAAMTPVWDVAPHPEATDREGPGDFREHDIHSFEGGMKPPTWPLVPGQVQLWVDEVCELGNAIRAGAPLAMPLPEALAKLHDEFERIRPFSMGTVGRVG